MTERTLSIIKPDAVAKNVIGQIVARFEGAGLKVVAARLTQLSQAEAEAFYAVHKARPFFKDLVSFMISGPVFVQVLEGENAIHKNRDLMDCPIPDTYPNRLHDYLLELKGQTDKKTKTISLNTTLTAASWKLIRHGFWFAAPGNLLFFPMPSVEQLQNEYYDWWRAAN